MGKQGVDRRELWKRVHHVSSAIGIRLYGLLSTPCGLGVAAANTRRVLESGRYPLAIYDIDSSGVPRLTEQSADLPSTAINLVHLNPNWIDLMLERSSEFDFRWSESLNVAVPFWELPTVSAEWMTILSMFDAVLAPTRFIFDALTSSGITCPVLHMPQAVYLPLDIAPDRKRFCIRPDALAVAMSFATGSLVARKNPMASVDAFLRAFSDVDDVTLVVRVHEQATGATDPSLEELRLAAANDDRIVLVEGFLDYSDVLSLYASCDIYLSLHRSEGLGLGMMEAMTLGKAVVATGWSGNMDFMNEENSSPVRYDLVPAELGTGTLYGDDIESSGVHWAEPDGAHAAETLRFLYDNVETREAVGRAARESMDDRRAFVGQGSVFEDLAGLLGTGILATSDHEVRAARLEARQSTTAPSVSVAPRRASMLRRVARFVARRLR